MTLLILAYAAILSVVVGLGVRMLLLCDKFEREAHVVGHRAQS